MKTFTKIQALVLSFISFILVPFYAMYAGADGFGALLQASSGAFVGLVLSGIGYLITPDPDDDSDRLLRSILSIISWVIWWGTVLYTLVSL